MGKLYDDRYKFSGANGDMIDAALVKQLQHVLDEAMKGNVKSIVMAVAYADERSGPDDGIVIGQPDDVPLLTAQALGALKEAMHNFRQMHALSQHPLGKAN